MRKIFKGIVILFGALFVLLVLGIVLIPLLVDINHYKPQIEEQVVKATGHSFSLGGDLKLSLFPWVGISISDVHFGNPKGFAEKDMASVKDFRVKVKVLPLLSKKIEVKEFVLSGARVVLETRKDGRTGWEDLAKGGTPAKEPAAKKEPAPSEPSGLPITDLQVAEFAITDASLLWLDQKNGLRKEVKAFEFVLNDLSFDQPIGIKMSAVVDNYPLSLKGKIGPVGKEPGKGNVPVDISIAALNQINAALKGVIDQPAVNPAVDLNLSVEQFSLRKLMAALKQTLPLEPADVAVLEKIAISMQLSGNPKAVSISKGILALDDSKLNFSATAKEFDKPNVAFDVKLDQIDLDRYLPAPPPETESQAETATQTETSTDQASPKKIDYTPLRKLVLDGKAGVGRLKVKNVKVENISLKVVARNGLLSIDPFAMDLYKGKSRITANVNVQKESPRTDLKMNMNGIQAGTLIGDFLKKDILEGTLQSDVSLNLAGDTPEQIKKSLNGKGSLEFQNGAVKGVDLGAMAHNTAEAFGLIEKGKAVPKTEFTELSVLFNIVNGVFDAQNMQMVSPVMQLQATGKADLVKESLNFRIEPKFVNPLKDQGKKVGGILVPVVVTGTFENPKFKPDLKAALKQNLGVDVDKEAQKLKENIKKDIKKGINKKLSDTKTEQQVDQTKQKVKEEAEKLLKKLPFSK